MISKFIRITGPVVVALVLAAPCAVKAQNPDIAYACYVPDVGAVYRIDPYSEESEELPDVCLETTDVMFSWVLGDRLPLLLPDNCDSGQIPHYDGTEWICADPGATHTHDQYALEGHTHATDGVLYDMEMVSVVFTIAAGSPSNPVISYAQAYCTEGRKVVSGGFSGLGKDGKASANYPSLTGNYWGINVWNYSILAATGTVYAICAHVG